MTKKIGFRAKKSVFQLLSGEIDPQSESFWTELIRSLELTDQNQNVELDRRAIINLKLILSCDKLDKIKIQAISFLLSKIGIILPNDFANDLGDLFIELMLRGRGQLEKESLEYSNELRQLATKRPNFKVLLFKRVIDSFARWLYDPFSLTNKIISEMFLFNITLISGKTQIKRDFQEHVSLVHLSGASKLLQECHDSIAQITIAEWIWRAIRLIDCTKQDIDKALGDMMNIQAITKESFREQLHDFVRMINGKPSKNSKVIHILFTEISLDDDVELKLSGCFDINEDNVAIFFNEKSGSIPDVIIFRSNYITQASNLGKDEISFTTREKTQAFKSILKEPPTKFIIQIESNKENQTAAKEFVRRLFQSKVPRTSIDLSTNKNIETPRTVAPRKGPNTSIKTSPFERSVITVDSSEDESEQNDDISGKTKKSKQEKKKKQKQLEMSEIESRLNECAENSIRKIESTYDTCIHTAKDISNELANINQALGSLLNQHIEITKRTTEENSALSESVAKLQKEFEARHSEAVTRRESVKKQALSAIAEDKKEIISKSDAAFNTNVIVGFATSLEELPQKLQAELC